MTLKRCPNLQLMALNFLPFRVSFGSSKGSMVETVIFESPQSEEWRDIVKTAAAGNGISNSEPFNTGGGAGNETDSIDSPTTAG